MTSNPENILVIHFGQLGDVILGLPALDALHGRFPDARITTLSGTPSDQILRLSGVADETIAVDRWALKRGPKPAAVREMIRLAMNLRRRGFDLVVDLHTYYETGLLARATGAPVRVGARRRRRTLEPLYTHLAPPEDPSAHYVDRYLAVVARLGAEPRALEPRLVPERRDAEHAARFLDERFEGAAAPVVGLNPGAGWEVKRWPAERFVEVGRALAVSGARVLVFAGPEETGLGEELARSIGPAAAAAERLTLGQLAAVMQRCSLVISNDTGPAHIAAAVGAPLVILMPGNAGPSLFEVRSHRARQLFGDTVRDITVEEVLAAAAEALERAV